MVKVKCEQNDDMKIIRFHERDYQTNPVFDSDDEVENRYSFDFEYCSSKRGWAQLDTVHDASYYGAWANIDELLIVTYIEGDITIIQCDTLNEFREQLYSMNEYEIKGGNRLRIDPGLSLDTSLKYHKAGLGDLLHESYQNELNDYFASQEPALEAE